MRHLCNGTLLPMLIATVLVLVVEAERKQRSDNGAWDNRLSEVKTRRDIPSNALKKDHGNDRAFRRNRKRQRGFRMSNGENWSPWQPYGTHSESRGANQVVASQYKSQLVKDGGPKVASYDIRPEDRLNARKRGRKTRNEKPNIVVILTDDQDSELGSIDVMKKTLHFMRDGGVTFKNSFVSTPMCCPSRSSFLTGMYVHNHNIYTNNDNCSSPMWRETHETRNFGAFLSNAGYRTGYFGKYLNEYDGKHIPPGWREWVGLVRNSRFYNYSVNFNGEIIRHGFEYGQDYLTDLIANDSVTFLRQSKQYFPSKPIAMVLSVPAPHGPEDAAPQFQHLFKNNTSHRTPSWNHAPNPDHQWILANTGKMEPIHIAFTDMLHQKRLQTLMSVDDLVQKVITELRTLGELDNTYILYTSDHGYHLGQFGLLKGKAMPYDFDVRVPLLVRGPGLQKGVTIENLVQNIDIAPTLLDIAGIDIPAHMDGRSFLPLLHLASDSNNVYNGIVRKKKAWRDTVLLERGKLTRKNIKTREKLEQKQQNRITKEQARVDKCKQPDYASPCRPGQKWECRENERGRLRMYKCRLNSLCRCPDGRFGRKPRDPSRGRRLKKRQNKASRGKRDVDVDGLEKNDNNVGDEDEEDIYDLNEGSGDLENAVTNKDNQVDESAVARRCRVLANNTVVCDQEIYDDVIHWKRQKAEVNKIIQNYRRKLEELRGMRRHLRNKKPVRPIATYALLSTPEPQLPTTRRIPENPYVGFVPDYDQDCVCDAPVTTTPTPTPTPEPVYDDLSDEALDLTEDYDEETSQRMKKRLDRLTERLETNPSPKIRQKVELLSRRIKKMKKRARRRQKEDGVARKCKSSRMKCFTHDNDHWKTKPLWTPPRRDPACSMKGVECHRMDNEHWKTEPKWTRKNLTKLGREKLKEVLCAMPDSAIRGRRRDGLLLADHCARLIGCDRRLMQILFHSFSDWLKVGPFCFCPNSANNTYWCLRTINDTHNFLYCEFITGFMSFYDMTRDPWQLRNAIHDLHYTTVHELHDRLEKMKRCKGSRECTHRTRGGMEVPDLRNELTGQERARSSQSKRVDEDKQGTDGKQAKDDDDLLVAEGSGALDEEGSGEVNKEFAVEGSGEVEEKKVVKSIATSPLDRSKASKEDTVFVEYGSGEGSGEAIFLDTATKEEKSMNLNKNFTYYKEQSNVI